MSVTGNPPRVVEAGEYGATTVALTRDGTNLRLAFGRNDLDGTKTYYGAVLLTQEAVAELKEHLEALGS